MNATVVGLASTYARVSLKKFVYSITRRNNAQRGTGNIQRNTTAPHDPLEAVPRTIRIPPVPCREDLVRVAEMKFRVLGRAVEVGVYKGVFAKHNIRQWGGDYWCVDAWGKRPEQNGTARDPALHSTNMMHMMSETVQRLKPYGSRVHITRQTSLEAARSFEDRFFDWVYIDALHTYEASLDDMRAWWPKLRSGGLFSGDDYGDYQDTALVHAERWRHTYGPAPVVSRWGVARAAQQFADEVGRQLMITWMKGHTGTQPSEGNVSCYLYPAWYLIK